MIEVDPLQMSYKFSVAMAACFGLYRHYQATITKLSK